MTQIDHVFFIVLDTLRLDYSQGIMEYLRGRGFKIYSNVVAPAPWTLPSHASMFTGLYPSLHGARETYEGKVLPLRRRDFLLTRILKRLGFKNYLLSANPLISPDLGFTYFDHVYEVELLKRIFLPPRLERTDLDKLVLLRKKYPVKAKYLLKLAEHPQLFMKVLFATFYSKTHLEAIIPVLKQNHRRKGRSKIIRTLKKILSREKRNKLFVFINIMEPHEPYSVF